MDYRRLLVHLDRQDRWERRMPLVGRIAHRWHAQLLGVAATGELPWAADPALGGDGLDALNSALAQLRQWASARAQRFRNDCEHAAVRHCETTVEEGDDVPALLRHAERCDLVVLTRPQEGISLVQQIVLESPRPILLLPQPMHLDDLGRCVVIGWSDTREAARAIADALPVLRRADRVVLMHCQTPETSDGHLLRERLAGVRNWLAVHKIDAQTLIETSSAKAAHVLLTRAAELEADLVVCGAYGHARWREQVLGGVTQTLLQTSQLPLLMSH